MTDEAKATTHTSSGSAHGKPSRVTPEQVAAMSADEKEQLIRELEASLEELRRPVPQPYPKWVEIDGVSMIVETEEEEQRKTKAAAEAKTNADRLKMDEGESHSRRR